MAVQEKVKQSSAVKIRPLHDRILVEPLEAEEKTASGIVIPDTAKEKQQRGKVIGVGKGKVNDKGNVVSLEVQPGDEVLYGKYSGTEIKIEGKEFLILKEEDVLAILK